MVHIDKLEAIAKPRDKKAHRKFVLWHKFGWIIRPYQNILLYIYSAKRKLKERYGNSTRQKS